MLLEKRPPMKTKRRVTLVWGKKKICISHKIIISDPRFIFIFFLSLHNLQHWIQMTYSCKQPRLFPLLFLLLLTSSTSPCLKKKSIKSVSKMTDHILSYEVYSKWPLWITMCSHTTREIWLSESTRRYFFISAVKTFRCSYLRMKNYSILQDKG